MLQFVYAVIHYGARPIAVSADMLPIGAPLFLEVHHFFRNDRATVFTNKIIKQLTFLTVYG
ncbi:hypothetical protein, partial [Salmonella sp. s51944]|uniref:hypothetical protein n=1 Tax=Salmonella sp. s51944 TaxID=3159655 RepID=UPI00398089C5